MADIRPQYNEEAVGANHPTKADVINRAYNVEHDEDGTHGNITTTLNLTSGQIAFPAAQNASADPNTMDDYEEGYHMATVVCSTSGNYTLAGNEEELAYTKVGRVVQLQGTLHIIGENVPDGQLRISLPFAVAVLTDRAEQSEVPIVITNHGDAGIENPVLLITSGLSYMPIYNILDNGTEEVIDHTRVDTNFYITLNLNYIAA